MSTVFIQLVQFLFAILFFRRSVNTHCVSQNERYVPSYLHGFKLRVIVYPNQLKSNLSIIHTLSLHCINCIFFNCIHLFCIFFEYGSLYDLDCG